MRFVSLGVVLALAAPLAAQTPDPTPPEQYVPLGVGDVREYRSSGGFTAPTYDREVVLGDTVAGGRTYRLVETQFFSVNGAPTGRYRRAVRFDSAQATVMQFAGNGSEYPVFACRLDLPFPDPDTAVVCPDAIAMVTGQGVTIDVVLGADTLVTAVKSFDGLFGGVAFAAGLGELWSVGDASDRVRALRFARIDGVAYGSPDPLLPPLAPEPSAYWPLEVRNTWVMRYEGAWARYDWRTVVGTTTVSDTSYAVVEACTRPDTQPTTCSPTHIRVDNRTGEIRQRMGSAERPIMCGLLPTATPGPVACDIYNISPWRLDIDAPATVQIAGQTVPTPSIRRISIPDVRIWYAAGIGPLPPAGLADAGTLVYVRLGSTTYGTNPVAGEAAPSSSRLALRAVPNPTAGPLAVALDLPAPAVVTVEAFDALGRRVHVQTQAAPAGETPLDVDARRWAPGLYVVRATTADATATVRVVRR